ncbi:hypothetical protein CBM2589_B30200 [Cupriavidus taiwanensis]|uniref:Uncharacterized protein n=1 Tax=Cupriavidus taiwanensis TaxID=164546 RepID=A0A375BUW0_9BURK|nr:hypothetical protein CBM2589_B30200 [Cupriavidus taiwanensis]
MRGFFSLCAMPLPWRIGFDLLPSGTKAAAGRSFFFDPQFDTQFAEGPCDEGSRHSGGNS